MGDSEPVLWQQAFEKHLRRAIGPALRLHWTNNRRVMISFQHKKGVPVLRLHESFSYADKQLQDDLVRYLTKPRTRIPKTVTEFINNISSDENAPRREPKVSHRGEIFDLRKIYRKLNRLYFEDKLSGKISWGRRVFLKRKSSITFGAYFPSDKLIRIHPVLDTELVPPFYIESVIHHEMVHEYLNRCEPDEDKKGHGSPRFKELERKFKFHQLAQAWEKSHLTKLLTYKPKK